MNTNIIVAIVVVIIVVGFYFVLLVGRGTDQRQLVGRSTQPPSDPQSQPPTPAQSSSAATPQPQPKPKIETPAGLKIDILQAGAGVAAKTGDTVTVHYLGTLTTGEKFDASRDHGQPFSFPLGAGQVIKGWDLGVVGMKVGEQRRLTISPELGYGANGTGPIPPNSTLIFEVELLKID